MKKRVFALVTLMVLLVLAASTALAINPTAELVSGGNTVKPGKTINFIFKLNSGTYTKKGDVFRAKLGTVMIYNKKTVGASSWVWTGVQRYKLRARIAEDAPLGKYTLKYTTYRRKNASVNWKKIKTQKTTFTVKK